MYTQQKGVICFLKIILDPRTKMIMVLCISCLALVYNKPGPLFLLFIFTTVLLYIFGFKLTGVLGYLKTFFFLVAMLFVIQLVFAPSGEVLLSLGPLNLVTTGGLTRGASVALRIMVVAAAALLFTTFNARDLILGLVQWKIPYEIAFMVSIALRFLPIFRDEFVNVVTAVQLRGVELKNVPWGEKIGLYKSLFFPVVYGAMLKAEQLAVAMEGRGFRAYPQRTYLRRLEFNYTDYVLMLLFFVVTCLLVCVHTFTV